MNSVVIAVAGRIGSGKTSVAAALADTLRWPRVGFGDYVRLEAAKKGLDPGNREILQELGEVLLRRDVDGFCRAVLAQIDPPAECGLVVDGVRHVLVLEALRRLLSPKPVYLIYLAATNEARRLRLMEAGRSHGLTTKVESHSTEADLESALPAFADAVLDADRSLEAVITDAFARIQKDLGAIGGCS